MGGGISRYLRVLNFFRASLFLFQEFTGNLPVTGFFQTALLPLYIFSCQITEKPLS
jgi:hypothetical protein